MCARLKLDASMRNRKFVRARLLLSIFIVSVVFLLSVCSSLENHDIPIIGRIDIADFSEKVKTRYQLSSFFFYQGTSQKVNVFETN